MFDKDSVNLSLVNEILVLNFFLGILFLFGLEYHFRKTKKIFFSA